MLPQPLTGGYNVTSAGAGNQQLSSMQNQHQSHPQLSQLQSNRGKYRSINLRDLFIAPPFDELDAVAMDGVGEPRRLTNSQLKSLRDRGYVSYILYSKVYNIFLRENIHVLLRISQKINTYIIQSEYTCKRRHILIKNAQFRTSRMNV